MNKKESVRIVEGEDALQSLLGKNPAIREIRSLIRKAAPTDATILITGESGSGKEVVADCIYGMSRRKDKPFVKINCAAIPPNLLEAELFGYERGAFTGANARKIGLFEVANHGTILLDEIGDFPLELQPKLLRVLQQGELYRIGCSTPVKLDVRVIAATNAKAAQYTAEVCSAASAVAAGAADMSCDAANVRASVVAALELLSTKRAARLPKKHGNMAL